MLNPIHFLRLILIGSMLQVTMNQATAQQPNADPGSQQMTAIAQPPSNPTPSDEGQPGQPGPVPLVMSRSSAIQQFTQPTVSPGYSGIAGNTPLSQVLGVPSSFCGHVIDRLLENQMRQNCGVRGYDTGPVILHSGISGPLQPGDLQLQSVQLISDTNGVQGPVFLVTLQNQSSIPVGDFQITLVAVTGTIHVCSPSVTGSVPRIDAGACVPFQIQLPACHFDTLVAVIDSFDELLECDELNNVQILSRLNIPTFVSQTTVITSIESVVSPAIIPDPAAGGGAAIVPDNARLPGDQALPVPSPLDGFDLDQLQPGESDSITN
jgi:hypothetical protein